MFFLTGSQRFHLMENVSETLAGRLAVIDILGLSQAEIMLKAELSKPFIPAMNYVNSKNKMDLSKSSLKNVYEKICRGSFPKLIAEEAVPRDPFLRFLC